MNEDGMQYLVCALFGLVGLITYILRRSIKKSPMTIFMLSLTIVYGSIEFSIHLFDIGYLQLTSIKYMFFIAKLICELLMLFSLSNYLISWCKNLGKKTIFLIRLGSVILSLIDIFFIILSIVAYNKKLIDISVFDYGFSHNIHIICLSLLSISGVLYSVNARKRVGKYSFRIILFFSLLLMISIFCFFKRVNVEFATAYALFVTILFINIENSGQYMNSIYDSFNNKAFQDDLNFKNVLNFDTTFVFVKVNKIELIKDRFDDNKTSSIIYDLLKREQEYFSFNNVFYLENEYYVVKTTAFDEDDFIKHIKSFFENTTLLNTYALSVYPCFSKIKFRAGEKVTKKLLSESFEVFTYLYKRLKPFEMLDFSFDLVDAVKRENDIYKILKKAVLNRSFKVFYQPIFNSNTKCKNGAEALVRLDDLSIGFISPEEFIPIAEKHGLIFDIDKFVFEEVTLFIKKYGTELKLDYIDVNLSHNEISNKIFVEDLITIINENKVSSDTIRFEITETSSSGDDIIVNENMIKLKNLGFKFSLDDYGSGYASLDYLTKFDFDLVKIDKSILWGLLENPNKFVLFDNVVKLIRNLKKEIVVEGVESLDHVKLLNKLNIKLMQGYYYSRPLAEEDFILYLEEVNANV